MAWRSCALAAALSLAACSGGSGGEARPPVPAGKEPGPPAPAGPRSPAPESLGAPKGVEPKATAAGTANGEAGSEGSDQGLEAEETEENPRSEKVTIKISVDPPVRGTVILWGRKNLGKPPLELVRERGSGPLDLVVRAPGYLPFHTRAFTDRDDKLHVRLVTEKQATSLLGWKPPAPDQPAKK